MAAASRSRVCRSSERGPTSRTYCSGRSSPLSIRVRGRRRTLVPPASTMAQGWTESGGTSATLPNVLRSGTPAAVIAQVFCPRRHPARRSLVVPSVGTPLPLELRADRPRGTRSRGRCLVRGLARREQGELSPYLFHLAPCEPAHQPRDGDSRTETGGALGPPFGGRARFRSGLGER